MRVDEFSKWIVLFSWLLGALWITFSFFLALIDKNPNETVTVTICTEVLGTTIGYFAYQGHLKNSTNKYGTDRDGVPWTTDYYDNNESEG